jgi:hypothetical protein
MENLLGQIVEVIVSKNGKVASKNLKVCKVNSRSILFIEVDKVNRKNTFRKFKVKNVEKVGTKTDGGTFVLIEDAIMPDKWESSWDSIGQPTQQIRGRGLASQFSKHFSNHSKGWSANAPQYRSTTYTNGFPMV